jgi:hypothetical protein
MRRSATATATTTEVIQSGKQKPARRPESFATVADWVASPEFAAVAAEHRAANGHAIGPDYRSRLSTSAASCFACRLCRSCPHLGR